MIYLNCFLVSLPEVPASRVSGDLTAGGNVIDFKWAPDNSLIAYSADQITNGIVELFTSPPNNNTPNNRVSGISMAGSGITEFMWALNSSRIGYLADQDTVGEVELYTSKPDSTQNVKVSGDLVAKR